MDVHGCEWIGLTVFECVKNGFECMFIDCPRCTSIQIYPNEDETYIQIYPNIVNTKWRGEKWIDMGNPSQSTGDTPLVSDTPVEATTPFFDAEKHIVVSTGFCSNPRCQKPLETLEFFGEARSWRWRISWLRKDPYRKPLIESWKVVLLYYLNGLLLFLIIV